MAILEFKDEFDWLSNFHPVEFVWDNIIWPTSEHAYQAAKVLDRQKRIEISRMPAYHVGKVKRLGKTLELVPNWDSKKISVMSEIVFAKFNQNSELKQKLFDTGNEHIEEGNHWGDTFWGICPVGSGQGMNQLGEILMEIREEFRRV